MSNKNFTYVNTTEEGDCPYCGAFVPKGVSVCENCHAVHGQKLDGFASFLMLPVVGAALFGGGMAGVYSGNGFLGVIAAFAIFISCAVGIMKLFTSKGWFR